MTNNAYSNFVGFIKSDETRRGYQRDLHQFLEKISDDFFMQHLKEPPKSRDLEDLCESFVNLANKDMLPIKASIKAYVKHLKSKVEKNELGANSVPNKLKPIRALLVSNEIDISMSLIRKMFPRETQTQDRAYTREEIGNMIQQWYEFRLSTKLILIIFMI